MGKSQPGSGDGLFHFQLDLPEKKKPGTTSGSRAGSQRTAGAGTGRGVGSEGANGTFQTGSVNRTYQNRNQTSSRQQASSGGYGSRAGSGRTGQSAGTGSRTGASGRTYTGSTPSRTRTGQTGGRTGQAAVRRTAPGAGSGTQSGQTRASRPGQGTGRQSGDIRRRPTQGQNARRRRSPRQKLPDIRDITKQQGAGNKAKFLLAFILVYIGVAYKWFRRELTPDKILKNEKRPGKFNLFFSMGTFFFFPAAIFWLELVFHIYMKLGIRYIPIWLFFSIAGGFLCALLTSYFPERVNKIVAKVLTFLLGLIFCIEIVCKTVLAQYYQLASSLTMAMENHLTDYTGAIIEGILMNLIGIILMFVPFILLMTLLRNRLKFARKPPALALLSVIGMVVCHICALICLHLPYGGELKPAQLYKTDTEIEEQVRQLGLLTMLRLDIKHSIFGVDRNLSINTEELDKINSLQQNAPGESGGESSGESETEAQTVVDTSPNVLDLDFDGLTASTSNESVQWLNEYFSSLTPTNKNEYTGMFKGYNVIFITAEGFSGYMIDKELTPTLYKLTHEGFVFNNFYTALHYTSTSGGECQNLLGLYPKNGEPRTMGMVGTSHLSMPFTLANQLNNLGYNSIGYHFNVNMYDRDTSHPQIGYDWNDASTLELEKNQYGNNIWPQSDNYMVEQTFDLYVDQQPFNIYYMTISGHMPYVDNGNSMAVRNYDQVADLPYSEDTKCYIAANLELEKGLTTLVNDLEEAGIADKTLIVMAPDHIPYFDLPVLEELTGETFGDSEDTKYLNEENLNFEVYKNSLIIWSASMDEPIEVDKVCCQVDILPTVSNLLGLNYDSRLLEGSDILSDSEGLVVFSSRSWKSDRGLYNSYTGKFTPADGVTMTDDQIDTYVDAMKTAVSYKMQATTLIQDTDYYSLILPDGAPVNEADIIEPGSMETSSGGSESSDTGTDDTRDSSETSDESGSYEDSSGSDTDDGGRES